MKLTIRPMDTYKSSGTPDPNTVGILIGELIVKVDGTPFQTEPAAKTQLKYYQNQELLLGNEMIPFRDGWVLMGKIEVEAKAEEKATALC